MEADPINIEHNEVALNKARDLGQPLITIEIDSTHLMGPGPKVSLAIQCPVPFERAAELESWVKNMVDEIQNGKRRPVRLGGCLPGDTP